MASFEINARLDIGSVRKRFERNSRVQIDDFLIPAAAITLRQDLEQSDRWRRVINGADEVFEIPAAEFDALAPPFKAQLDRATHRAAATGFQYQYDSIRVPDNAAERLASAEMIDRFAVFLSSAAAIEVMREIAGGTPICFADAQATRYRPRDFLTRHDDAIAGKDRVFAYVLNLVQDWRPEWGGLLSFVGDGNQVAETFVPRFNSLSLFAVGQQHFVSAVADYAPASRISVTGWLRTSVPAD